MNTKNAFSHYAQPLPVDAWLEQLKYLGYQEIMTHTQIMTHSDTVHAFMMEEVMWFP